MEMEVLGGQIGKKPQITVLYPYFCAFQPFWNPISPSKLCKRLIMEGIHKPY